MKLVVRALMLIVVLICFAPVIVLWLLSLLALPIMVVGILGTGALELLAWLMATVLGGVGLWGTGASLVVLWSKLSPMALKKQWAYLLSGWAAAAIGIVIMKNVMTPAIFTVPALVSWHLFYLLNRVSSRG